MNKKSCNDIQRNKKCACEWKDKEQWHKKKRQNSMVYLSETREYVPTVLKTIEQLSCKQQKMNFCYGCGMRIFFFFFF